MLSADNVVKGLLTVAVDLATNRPSRSAGCRLSGLSRSAVGYRQAP